MERSTRNNCSSYLRLLLIDNPLFICSSYNQKQFHHKLFIKHFVIVYQMDKFITQYVEPLLKTPQNQNIKSEKLTMFQTDLKIFVNSLVKGQSASVNKQLTKKVRQIFILSSDNQALKQMVQDLQNSLQIAKGQIAEMQKQKAKQKIITDKQILDLNKTIQNNEKEAKSELAELKMKKQVMQQSYKTKIKDIKNDHQIILNNAIDQEKRLQEQQSQTMKKQFQQEISIITKQNNDRKREIIKKYENQISKLISEYEDKIYLLNKQFQQHKKQSKDVKGNLQNKIATLQNNVYRLKIELAKQQQAHAKFKQLYHKTYEQLSQNQQKSLKEKQTIEQELHGVKISLMQQERKYATDMKELNTLFKKTVQEKDYKYLETVQTMQTDFKIKIDSLETQLIQQKQVAVSQVQIKRNKENYQHEQRFQAINQDYVILQKKYETIAQQYEQKLSRIQSENQDFIQSLNSRKDYELQVTGKNAQREFNALRNKYQLQIKAIYDQHNKQLEQLTRKNNDEKIALTNKLTTQYESMINDQKISNQVQIKQKLIEFDRKAKAFENKLKDAQKKKSQLKVSAQRIKMQMQMRVDSMVELNQYYESEVSNMNQKVQSVERQKQKAIHQYELKILILKNQMKATKHEFQQRQKQLKQLLESKLRAKNQQISKILARVKKQTQVLIISHQKRVQAIQKEYNQLKRVIGQKTSLPEDIEALRVFHDAYLEKQKQLQLQRLKVQQLHRQLKAKDAIDKVFAEKGSKIHSNFNTPTIISFKSNQI